MAFCSSGRFVQYTQILIVLHYKSNMIRKKQEHSVKFWLVCLLVKCMSHMIPLTSHITYSYAPTSPLKKGGKGFVLASQNTSLQSREPITSRRKHI